MATKIKLGARPKSFQKLITVPLPEGVDGTMTVDYVYRTRTEFGEFIDNMFASGKAKPPAPGATEEEVKFSLERLLTEQCSANADYILKVIDGWDLDEPFSRTAVVQLCDELPGVALAIIEQYRAAVSDGRLGN